MNLLSRLLAVGLLVSVPAWAQSVPASQEQIRLSFAPVVKQVSPAVVNIYTKRVVRQAASPLLSDPFFRRFFGDVVPHGMPQERVQNSLGSGVIVAADGTVVTNHHVINGADEVTVVLADRREFEAKILGDDASTDLAILKIEPPRGDPLPALPMGDSDKLEVGDLVIAVGNPFGVGQTVTSGIISALARTNVGITDYRSFIQTDAAINPGNSGGALVDMEGRLIGINSAIYSKDGGSNGIGFAIPTTMVKTVLASIKSTGKVVRPWLGAMGQPVTNELAQALGLSRPVGVLIDNVHRDGPAAKAGLKPGDVITAVDGHEIDDAEVLRFRLATHIPGDAVEVKVTRQGTPRSFTVHLIAPPESPPREITDVGGANPYTGATIANLNPALAEELGMDSTASGVVVLKIKRGSIAHRLRMQPGDILLEINGQPISTVFEAKRALSGKAKRWALTINRDGQVLTLQVGG